MDLFFVSAFDNSIIVCGVVGQQLRLVVRAQLLVMYLIYARDHNSILTWAHAERRLSPAARRSPWCPAVYSEMSASWVSEWVSTQSLLTGGPKVFSLRFSRRMYLRPWIHLHSPWKGLWSGAVCWEESTETWRSHKLLLLKLMPMIGEHTPPQLFGCALSAFVNSWRSVGPRLLLDRSKYSMLPTSPPGSSLIFFSNCGFSIYGHCCNQSQF